MKIKVFSYLIIAKTTIIIKKTIKMKKRIFRIPQPAFPAPLKPKIPERISKLVTDCVKDDPAQRPSNMMTIITRLDLIIHSLIGKKIQTNKNA